MLQIIYLIKQRLVTFYYHNVINYYFYIRMHYIQYLIIDIRAISYQILKLENFIMLLFLIHTLYYLNHKANNYWHVNHITTFIIISKVLIRK